MTRRKRAKHGRLANEKVLQHVPARNETVSPYFAGSKPGLPAAADLEPEPDVGVAIPTPADAAAEARARESNTSDEHTQPTPVREPPVVPYTPPSSGGRVRTTIPDGGTLKVPAVPFRANGNMTKPGQQLPTILPEIPGDLLRELAEKNGNATVFVRISRRSTTDGKMSIMGNAHLATLELLRVDSWLTERGGGGEYFVEVRDLTEQASLLVPKFRCSLEGTPRKFVASYTQPEGPPGYYGGAPTGMPGTWGPGLPGAPPPPQPVPGGYIPQEFQQQGPGMQYPPYGYQPGFGLPAPGPVGPVPLSSDRVALQQVADLKQERDTDRRNFEVERRNFETERTRAEKDMEVLKTKIADLKEELRDAKHKADMDLIRAESRATKNGDSGFDVVKFAAAMAPIATAYLGSSGQRDIEHMKLLTAPKGDNELMKLLPALVPLALKLIESRSPAEQAQVLSTMFDAQAQNAALTAQIIQNMAQMSGGESPWVGLVQQLIGSGAEAIGKMVDARQSALRQAPAFVHQGRTMPLPSGGAPAQPSAPQAQPQPAQPQGPEMVSVPTNASSYMTVEDEPIEAEFTEIPPNGNGEAKHGKPGQTIVTPPPGTIFDETPGGLIAKIVYGHSSFPADLKTPEWLELIKAIHNQRDVETVANEILDLLVSLDERRELPAAFLSWSTQPEATFDKILTLLPIATTNKPYAADLVATLVQFVGEYLEELNKTSVETHGEAVAAS